MEASAEKATCYSTVRAVSPVQSERTSEMRYHNHADQCPWRCVAARQDNQHILLGSSRPPRNSNAAPESVAEECRSHTISLVKTGVQPESTQVRKRLRISCHAWNQLVASSLLIKFMVPGSLSQSAASSTAVLQSFTTKTPSCLSTPEN